MKISKVLIAYDGSECADAAVEDLRRAGLPEKAQAVMLSVVENKCLRDPLAIGRLEFLAQRACARIRSLMPGLVGRASGQYRLSGERDHREGRRMALRSDHRRLTRTYWGEESLLGQRVAKVSARSPLLCSCGSLSRREAGRADPFDYRR